MDISSVECFLAVAQYGSTTHAASALFMTQSSVSRKVQALEKVCGAKLFDRSKAGMALTPAGSTLLPMARRMVDRNAQWWRSVADISNRPTQLRVACPTMVAETLLLPFIADSSQRIFDVVEVPTIDIYETVREHAADLAMAPLVPPIDLETRLLFKLPFNLQVPPGHPDAGRGSIELEELEDYPILMSDLRSGARRSFQLLVAGTDCVFPRLRSVSRTHIAQALTAAGQGVTVGIDPPKYGLVSLGLHYRGEPIYCDEWAAWHPDHYAKAAIEETLDQYVVWARATEGIGDVAVDV
ncbi:LysR family transcriptional regulator [Brevibacterium sp. 50QC2O2]|jgi:DNA-binding transcriptional LysR family regulator|uniref:LysR family transcriptional regulator n=1 Tax=Brevibacterium TaxID=1696 RepID=UPI00211C8559|nr:MULTISPECIES: LysR family transcriptional regulator [unclassified Brevibacterium]MCQ9368452.1 LysR family transcriptional regulator [Brevibacterium sp. 91QC2O2]MCQ9385968.1 LysR family transcriptional regulator [Brevibacterium sp. 68QC2CO]MCQ9387366.1 LysR family transcriptional regulator [Brevibacterium sp. 50QC2O2]